MSSPSRGTGDLADVIQFTDVASTEVSFERRGDALMLKRGTSGDQITVNNFYGYTYYSATTRRRRWSSFASPTPRSTSTA